MSLSLAIVPPFDAAHAPCQDGDPDRYHDKGHDDYDVDAAYARWLCTGCPVIDACLTYALTVEVTAMSGRYGIWGGTTPRQRDRIARRQRKQRAEREASA